jgi:hypothetical protein
LGKLFEKVSRRPLQKLYLKEDLDKSLSCAAISPNYNTKRAKAQVFDLKNQKKSIFDLQNVKKGDIIN